MVNILKERKIVCVRALRKLVMVDLSPLYKLENPFLVHVRNGALNALKRRYPYQGVVIDGEDLNVWEGGFNAVRMCVHTRRLHVLKWLMGHPRVDKRLINSLLGDIAMVDTPSNRNILKFILQGRHFPKPAFARQFFIERCEEHSNLGCLALFTRWLGEESNSTVFQRAMNAISGGGARPGILETDEAGEYDNFKQERMERAILRLDHVTVGKLMDDPFVRPMSVTWAISSILGVERDVNGSNFLKTIRALAYPLWANINSAHLGDSLIHASKSHGVLAVMLLRDLAGAPCFDFSEGLGAVPRFMLDVHVKKRDWLAINMLTTFIRDKIPRVMDYVGLYAELATEIIEAQMTMEFKQDSVNYTVEDAEAFLEAIKL